MSIIDKLPEVKAVVAWGLDKIPDDLVKDSRVHTWRNFMDLGNKVQDNAILATMDSQTPGTCAVLIYTSGTTGNPKGVMLSHDNILYSGDVVTEVLHSSLPEDMIVNRCDMRTVSFLPLSHIAGLMFDLISTLLQGSQVFFAKPDALQGTLIESLQWARPTLFLAVPRIWEKFEDALKAAASQSPRILQALSGWAKGKG